MEDDILCVQNYACKMAFYVARPRSQNCHIMVGPLTSGSTYIKGATFPVGPLASGFTYIGGDHVPGRTPGLGKHEYIVGDHVAGGTPGPRNPHRW